MIGFDRIDYEHVSWSMVHCVSSPDRLGVYWGERPLSSFALALPGCLGSLSRGKGVRTRFGSWSVQRRGGDVNSEQRIMWRLIRRFRSIRKQVSNVELSEWLAEPCTRLVLIRLHWAASRGLTLSLWFIKSRLAAWRPNMEDCQFGRRDGRATGAMLFDS